jgi:hypothetical protein
MVRIMRKGEAAPAIRLTAMNWALPAKMKSEKLCASNTGMPAETAKAPKMTPKGTTPRRIGS